MFKIALAATCCVLMVGCPPPVVPTIAPCGRAVEIGYWASRDVIGADWQMICQYRVDGGAWQRYTLAGQRADPHIMCLPDVAVVLTEHTDPHSADWPWTAATGAGVRSVIWDFQKLE